MTKLLSKLNIKSFEINVEGREKGFHILIVPDSRKYKPDSALGESVPWHILDDAPAGILCGDIFKTLRKHHEQLFIVTHSPFVIGQADTLWIKDHRGGFIPDGEIVAEYIEGNGIMVKDSYARLAIYCNNTILKAYRDCSLF